MPKDERVYKLAKVAGSLSYAITEEEYNRLPPGKRRLYYDSRLPPSERRAKAPGEAPAGRSLLDIFGDEPASDSDIPTVFRHDRPAGGD